MIKGIITVQYLVRPNNIVSIVLKTTEENRQAHVIFLHFHVRNSNVCKDTEDLIKENSLDRLYRTLLYSLPIPSKHVAGPGLPPDVLQEEMPKISTSVHDMERPWV